jgi:type IV pilus assembly protein PilF
MRGFWKFCIVVVLPALLLVNACAVISGGEGEDKDTKIANTNLRLGIGYMEQGKLDDALEKLQKARDAQPNNAAVHSALALVYDQMQEYDKADQHYREAIDLNSEDGGFYNNYGVFLCRRGKYEKGNRHESL